MQILVLALKDFKLLMRDKLGAFFILGFPILMGLFFGMVMGGMSSGGRGKMEIAIIDNDNSEMSKKFIEALGKNESIRLVPDYREAAMESVRKGLRTGMLIIPKGFGEKAGLMWEPQPEMELGMDPSRSAESGMMQGFVMQAMLWGILGCVAGFSISIAKEHSQGTMVRLQVSPLSKMHILMGKALACFFASLLVMTVMVILGLILKMQPASFPKLIVAGLVTALCFVGIMMTIAVLGKTEQSVGGAGWAINMIMAMLGGCMIPVMFMPEFLQKFSVVSPIRWAILAIEGAIWREFSWTEMIWPCAILLAIGFVGFTVGTSILNRRQA